MYKIDFDTMFNHLHAFLPTARHLHMKFNVHIKQAGLRSHSRSPPPLPAACVVSIIHQLPSKAIYTSFYSQSALMLHWLHLSTPVQPVHACSFESPVYEAALLEWDEQRKNYQKSQPKNLKITKKE